jgi:Coenzyme PQQ synthesis protein D (PqqD)
MLTLDQRVSPHPAVVDTALDTGETVLLHLEGHTYYSLNATGTHIWRGIKQGLTLQAISQQLQATYAVEPTHADRSVLMLVEELQRQLLVQRVTNDTPGAQAT